jgi:hypothetical protein
VTTRELRREVAAYGDYDDLIARERWEPDDSCNEFECDCCTPVPRWTRFYLRRFDAPLTTTIAERLWLN